MKRNIYKNLISIAVLSIIFVGTFALAAGPGPDIFISGDSGDIVFEASGSESSSSAFCPSELTDLKSLVIWVICFITQALVPLAFAIALVLFIWGVVMYMRNADNASKRKEGAQYILWGIFALFVMLSVWGLVAVLSNTFGQQNAIPQLPVADPGTY
ncbi:hypothetical protein KC842_02290 [Candidatus Nomurabacteria bacterium]|nr:hypothetical protein [Candidatus Nomurabacteria bacterium]USN95076.1 MAG: hypothetical protein H6791_01470 [Candidatus Nomurabacteria bacterium]